MSRNTNSPNNSLENSAVSVYIKSSTVLDLRAYLNHYSVIIGYFRFKKLWRNRYITRYRVVELHFLLENIMICLYKYVDLAAKVLIKMHARRKPLPSYQQSPPSYWFTSTPLRIQDDNITEDTNARSPLIFRNLQ